MIRDHPGLVGTMTCNAVIATALHDDDDAVRRTAGEAIWEVWFRDDGDFARELRQAVGLPDVSERVAACDELIACQLFEPVGELRAAGGAVKAMKGGHEADEAMSVPYASR